MILQRCNDDLSQCTTYPPVKRENVCNELNTTYFGRDLFPRIQPPLKCPIKAVSSSDSRSLCINDPPLITFQGKYIFNRTIIDFAKFSESNLISGKYKSHMKVFDMKNGKPRQILCWNVITRVTGFSSRRN